MYKETCQAFGFFDIFTNPGIATDELREMAKNGQDIIAILKNHCRRYNTVMAEPKRQMANLIFGDIASLVITNQTSTPVSTETSYSGTIYTAGAADEYIRTGAVNPYQVGWNIFDSDANGPWGSFVLVGNTGLMINRAIAGVTKASGESKLVLFTGTVT